MSYDVQYKDGDGAWTGWQTDTTAISATFSGQMRHTYHFQSRARDLAGHVEAWPAQPDASTSVAPLITKYYYHGGKRVAMRQGGVVQYLHGDHLGSTSLTTDEDGGMVARQLYHPYGTTRYSEGTLATDFGFTGQRHDGTGLIFMHARYYHPALGRWTQADTIVPNLANLQEWNRYGYALNNPTRYIDPSGHQIEPPEYQPGNIAHTGTVGPHVASSETTVQYTDNVAADPSFVYRSPLEAKIRQFYVDNSVPGLPQDLVDNYYRELGDVKLTPVQMMQCNPMVDIAESKAFGAEYHSLRGGGEKYIEIQGHAGAGTNGTLGEFTVNYKGNLRVDAEGDWFFDGTVGFYDIYDFNPLYGEDRRDLVPEFKVRFTNVVLPGDSFTITSEEIPATQSNYSTLATYPGFPTYTPRYVLDPISQKVAWLPEIK